MKDYVSACSLATAPLAVLDRLPETVRQRIEAIRDILVLEDLSERPVIVSSWDELMA